MSITKFLTSIFAAIFLFFTVACVSYAAADEFLVTLLCKPDSSLKYDDYSVVNVTLICEESGKSYTYKLYPYNNFSDKILLPRGHYMVVNSTIEGRNDVIFGINSDTVDVQASTAIVYSLYDSRITTAATTTQETTQKIETTRFDITIPAKVSEKETHLIETQINTSKQNESTEFISNQEVYETTTYATAQAEEKDERSIKGLAFISISAIVIIAIGICIFKRTKDEI